jgi:UDP-3-O-[3-hydroxymyristoyl] N-acetylglucosamine deacetylase
MNVLWKRKTLSTTVSIEGVGLHSGIYTRLELRPAAAGDGIHFIRRDLHDLRIPALQSSTTALDYATSVGVDDVSVGTVEHLLSAIYACGISDVDLCIDGPEVPIVDGSAVPFVHLIQAAGTREIDGSVEPVTITETVHVEHEDRWIRIEPADRLSVHYSIDFPNPAIGAQRIDYLFDSRSFEREIAPARTYGFMSEVEKLRAVGLARGGSLENCIVLDDHGVTNGPLRFEDEFVRHKIVDLIGDLVLIGRPVVGRISAHKAGHALHSRFVRAVVEASERQGESDALSPRSRSESWA